MNNTTPRDAFVTTPDDAKTHPVKKKGSTFVIGSDFRSPRKSLDGLSYSFDYRNARFVLLDQFVPWTTGPTAQNHSSRGSTMCRRTDGRADMPSC